MKSSLNSNSLNMLSNDVQQQIQPLRTEIDKIDQKILSLISDRAKLAQKIGEIKQNYNEPIFKPEREKAILKSLQENNNGPLTNLSLYTIWKEIISACRSLEKDSRVAFLGPNGTFSQQAMCNYFGNNTNGVPCFSIDEVFKTLESRQAEFAIVPIENSNEGPVNRTIDLLLHTQSSIIGEIVLDVEHNLLSKYDDINLALSKSKIIAAHPQALAQCQNFFNNHPHLQNLERKAMASNALAAQLASQDETVLAVASGQAGNEYNLHSIKQSIQDDQNNRTRFIILGFSKTLPSGNDQTSLIISTYNEVGSIAKAIVPFSKFGLSMSRLQSRPAKNESKNSKEWEYNFLIDIEGHIDDEIVAQAVKEVEFGCKMVKVLGSYVKYE